MKRTPLTTVHESVGATLLDFAGWSMPLRYQSEAFEHESVRTGAGLFDLSHMGQIEISGREAIYALEYSVVSNIASVGVGRAKYTMICGLDGGVIDDLIVYRLTEEHALVVANAANVQRVFEAFSQRAANFDVQVRDTSSEWALIAIQGPEAARALQPLVSTDLAATSNYGIEASQLGHDAVLLARTGYTGEDGFEVFCRPEAALRIWSAIASSTAYQVTACGLAARDSLRLEAGMPLYGFELDRCRTPYDAGLGRIVALDKPLGFVGQNALRSRSQEAPRERLVGLVVEGRRIARSGAAVLEASTDDRIGNITSGVFSPTLKSPIAMAYLEVTRAETQSQVDLDIRGNRVLGRIVSLPFYKRPPRATS
jgi:aminomethyltransferase